MVRLANPGRAAISVASALLVGCALHAAPTHELASGEHAISSAEALGAAKWAPVELRLANEKLALGNRWMAARDYEPARWLAEQALADAELAAMKSRSHPTARLAVRAEQ